MMSTVEAFASVRRSLLWLSLLAGCLLASCEDNGVTVKATVPPPAIKYLAAPTLNHNPNPDAPLVGILNVQSDRPTRVVLDVTAGTDSWSIPLNDYQTLRSGPVVGFRPNSVHTVRVTLVDQSGTTGKYPTSLSYTTGPLPANFPPMSVVVSDPAKMEPGLTLVEPFIVPTGDSYLVALDGSGNVVWYYAPTVSLGGRLLDARRISNGNITFNTGRAFLEITPAGDQLTYLYANGPAGSPLPPAGALPIAIPTFHHEVSPMPSGHFVGLSQEVRTYFNYPASQTDLTQTTPSASVLGDYIVEFGRDGAIVNTWNLLDVLDPYRIGYGSLSVGAYGAKDWSHANSVVYDPNSDAFIVSVRHQDVVIKFKRNLASHGNPSDLVWMLGDPQGWGPTWQRYLLKPANFSLWPYHQHAAMVMANGDILLHDNGNFRAEPPSMPTPDNANFSGAVQFRVDETKLQVTQMWEYGSPATALERVYTSALGDADELPQTGNVLIDYGLITFLGGVATSKQVSRVLETTRTGQVVFQLNIGINDPSPSVGLAVQNYRADRVPTLNP
jgi:arylsulfate sulfotransferase